MVGRYSTKSAHGDSERLHVAVVFDECDVCLVHVASTRVALMACVAAYVAERQRAGRLWPKDASGVEALLAAGDVEAAVAYYFESAGRRWDRERLILRVIELDRTLDRTLGPARQRRQHSSGEIL